MKYDDGSAFRRALEDRLRNHSLQTGLPLTRLRKMVAFDRYLARLEKDQPGQWVLKGGLALQLRLGAAARTTRDMDVLLLDSGMDIPSSLRRAGVVDMEDWFSFEVGNPEPEHEGAGGIRFPLRSILDSRPFETFHVDVGVGDALVEAPVQFVTPDLLAFASIPAVTIWCYPLSQQIAEKLHAYTRLHASGESSRVKDFVDMLLIAGVSEVRAGPLGRSLAATFNQRGTHPLPGYLPAPPSSWEMPYKKLAGELGVRYTTLADAYPALQKFLDPILAGEALKTWDPVTWVWRDR